MIRNKKALKKIQRINDCLKYKDDKNNFPIQDIYFWDKFLINWRKYFKLNNNEDIFRYYDLDMVCCSPNIDPKIENVIVIEKTQSYIIYKGGFGSTLKLDFSQPVPYFIDFAVKEITDLDKYEFEDPNDRKRFEKSFAPVDMYGLTLPFSGQIENYRDDFFIMGNISEGREMAWRVLGLQNELLYISLYPEKLRSFAEKVADFDIELGKIQLSNKFVDGIMVYGDIAYKNGLLMSPNSWKKIYYPPLKRICTELKKFGKPIFYHTDGNYLEIINDLIEIGFDAVHPNEAKSGIDVVRLKEKYGKKISFMGNIDAARALSGSKENIKKELEYKISAITGGGYLPGGDDIPASVSPENYDFFIKLLKSYRKES